MAVVVPLAFIRRIAKNACRYWKTLFHLNLFISRAVRSSLKLFLLQNILLRYYFLMHHTQDISQSMVVKPSLWHSLRRLMRLNSEKARGRAEPFRFQSTRRGALYALKTLLMFCHYWFSLYTFDIYASVFLLYSLFHTLWYKKSVIYLSFLDLFLVDSIWPFQNTQRPSLFHRSQCLPTYTCKKRPWNLFRWSY